MDRQTVKKKIDKKLRWWVRGSKQNAIADMLLSVPCTCGTNPEQCDRHWIIDHPDYKEDRINYPGYKIERKMKHPTAIAKYLTADYCNVNVLKKRKNVCDLPKGKYIILSDIHQGSFSWDWDEHDFFWKNKELYAHVLNHYYEKNYTLIEMGDIEEFWLKRVARSFDEQWAFQRENFAELYDIRRKYHSENRYVKMRGNHDNLWLYKDRVKNYLATDVQLDQINIYEFAVIADTFLLFHGHQVDARNRDIDSKKGMIWTKVGAVFEFFIDTALFGRRKPPQGWEHHPQSRVVYERRIEEDIYNKQKLNYIYANLARLLDIYIINGHNHAPKCLPDGDSTFNSGCSVFEGIIYGIEINYDEDAIRVLDWNNDHGMPSAPTILCEKSISELEKNMP